MTPIMTVVFYGVCVLMLLYWNPKVAAFKQTKLVKISLSKNFKLRNYQMSLQENIIVSSLPNIMELSPAVSSKLFSFCMAVSASPIPQPEDPMAGMTEEQLQTYNDRIGGMICGLPAGFKEGFGILLNLNLLVLAVLGATTILASGLKFFLEKQVEDQFVEADRELLERGLSSMIFPMGVEAGKWTLSRFRHRQGLPDGGQFLNGDAEDAQSRGNRKARRQQKSKSN